MFNSISGVITEKLPDLIRVENSGIEWEFTVSAKSLNAFGTVGSKTKVFVYLLHREDQMKLFGFSSDAERSVFFELNKVDGIGPKQALKILSNISTSDLLTALDTEDLGRLEAVPGLGKKTAQKLVFTLKGKIVHSDGSPSEVKSAWDDIILSLTEMGYDKKRVQETVNAIVKETGCAKTAETEKDVFRRAIVALSG